MKKFRHLLFGIYFVTLSVAAGSSRGPTTCNSPDIPEQGSYSPKKEDVKFEVGESVTYMCEDGFILTGKETNKCHWTGSWTNPSPVCDAKVDYLDFSGVHISTKENVMYNLTDNSSSSCIPLGYNENITIYMTKKIALVAVRLWFGIDSFIHIDIDKCIHPAKKHITDRTWESFKCNVNSKPIDQVLIKIQVKENNKETSLCEMELYERGEEGCDSSLLYAREQSNGYFKFNRTRATLTCNYGYDSKNSKLICEDGVWRGQDVHCEKKWSRKSTLFAAIGAGCVVIIALFGIILYFIKKQRNREVVVVYNPPNVIAMPEQDYASVYYDTMPTGVPLPPTSSRPPDPRLNVEYMLPADAKRKIRQQSLPTDIIGHYDKLTESPIYHD